MVLPVSADPLSPALQRCFCPIAGRRSNRTSTSAGPVFCTRALSPQVLPGASLEVPAPFSVHWSCCVAPETATSSAYPVSALSTSIAGRIALTVFRLPAVSLRDHYADHRSSSDSASRFLRPIARRVIIRRWSSFATAFQIRFSFGRSHDLAGPCATHNPGDAHGICVPFAVLIRATSRILFPGFPNPHSALALPTAGLFLSAGSTVMGFVAGSGRLTTGCRCDSWAFSRLSRIGWPSAGRSVLPWAFVSSGFRMAISVRNFAKPAGSRHLYRPPLQWFDGHHVHTGPSIVRPVESPGANGRLELAPSERRSIWQCKPSPAAC